MSNSDNVLALNLSPSRAKKLLQELANDSGNVFFTKHAEERMEQRKISRTQVLRCLRHGYISEGPARSANGNWELTVESISAGDPLAVVAALDHNDKGNLIIVITSYTVR